MRRQKRGNPCKTGKNDFEQQLVDRKRDDRTSPDAGSSGAAGGIAPTRKLKIGGLLSVFPFHIPQLFGRSLPKLVYIIETVVISALQSHLGTYSSFKLRNVGVLAYDYDVRW
jgi:hypothetical protein